MSSRSAAFRIDSGQLRFAMMRNLTVILRDLNLGAWRPRQIDKTSLSRGRVVTFALSQTDTDIIIRICFTYHIFHSSEQPKDFLFFFGGKSSSFLATFDNIVINRLSSNARHRHRNTRNHHRNRNTRDFTNKQATCKRKIYFRVALKRTVVKIRKEISNLNRTTDPNNGLQRTDFVIVIGKI